MVEAIVGALRDRFGDGVVGLWLKGSAQRRWDGPIDYVPELSDLDIHFRVDDETGARLADLDTALAVHADIGARFAATFPSPTHVPRPQFVSADEVQALDRYVAPPAGTVRTLHGPAHVVAVDVDEEAARAADATALAQSADPRVLARATTDLVERPGHHLLFGLRHLSWRVAPLGPRVLSVLGAGYDTAWSANRTEAVALLDAWGQAELAGHITDFYAAAWVGFRSGWRDADAGRAAFAAGIRALRLGAGVVGT